MSAEDVARRITRKTKAIVPVHTYGNVCDMDALIHIASQHNIPVIEDSAESIFSKYNGKYAGTMGNISTFSFHATKTITTGEGGLAVTNDEELNRKMRLFRSHGMDRSKKYYWHELHGHNFRLTNIQAAIGVAQLEEKESIIAERKRAYNSYVALLEDVEGVSLQKFHANVDPVVWAFGIMINKERFSQGRDKVIEQLREKNIETRPGFYTPSMMNMYQCQPMPVCESVSKHVICLPFYPSLNDEAIAFICNELINLQD